MALFFGNPGAGDPGLLGKYLRWDREELRGDVSPSSQLDRVRELDRGLTVLVAYWTRPLPGR